MAHTDATLFSKADDHIYYICDNGTYLRILFSMANDNIYMYEQ